MSASLYGRVFSYNTNKPLVTKFLPTEASHLLRKSLVIINSSQATLCGQVPHKQLFAAKSLTTSSLTTAILYASTTKLLPLIFDDRLTYGQAIPDRATHSRAFYIHAPTEPPPCKPLFHGRAPHYQASHDPILHNPCGGNQPSRPSCHNPSLSQPSLGIIICFIMGWNLARASSYKGLISNCLLDDNKIWPHSQYLVQQYYGVNGRLKAVLTSVCAIRPTAKPSQNKWEFIV